MDEKAKNQTTATPQNRLTSVFYSKSIAKFYCALWQHYCFLETVARGEEHKAVLSKLSAASRVAHDELIRIAPTLEFEPNDRLIADLRKLTQKKFLIDAECMKKLFIRHEIKVLRHVDILERFLLKKLSVLKSLIDVADISGASNVIGKIIEDAEKRIDALEKFSLIRKKRYKNFEVCFKAFKEVTK